MAVKTTTTLGFTLLGAVVLAIVCACFAMASPYWLQRRQLSGNTVTNAGIWEICFLQHSIPKQYQSNKEYTGCFMFYGTAFANEKSYFTPWWLIGVQITMALGFLGTVLAGIFLLIYFLCITRDSYWIVLTMTSLILFLSGGCSLGAVITYGISAVSFEGEEHSWVRWPHFMYFSWGFGFGCLAALFAWVGFIVAAVEAMHKKRNVDKWIRSSQMSMAMSEKSLVSRGGQSAAPSTITQGAPPSYAASQSSYVGGGGSGGGGVMSSVSNALNKSSTAKSSVGASQPSLAPSSGGGGGGGRPGGIRSSMGKGRVQRKY